MNMTSDGKFVVCLNAQNFFFGRLRYLSFSITKTRCGGRRPLTGTKMRKFAHEVMLHYSWTVHTDDPNADLATDPELLQIIDGNAAQQLRDQIQV